MKKNKKIKLLKKQIRELSKRYQNLNEKVQILEKQSEAVNNSKLIDINDKLYQDNNIEKEIKDEEKRNSKYYELFKYVYMLNEGVHVDDIDGVILLRPTVSPIIYMQQIGRCLAAGDTEKPEIINPFTKQKS